MKPYLAILLSAGFLAAAAEACSSDDKATTNGTDAGADGSVGTGDDDDALPDGGVCEPTIGSTLTPCVCSAQGSVNADKPVCGCAGVTGQIGSGPQVGAVGGTYVCGATDATNSRLVMGVQSIQGGCIWTVDLKTGNRVFVSGTVTDPANVQTPQSKGTGDAMATPAAIRIGTDGWYAFEGTSSSKQIQKVDPTSGARTTLLTADQMTSKISGGHPIACTGGPALDTSLAIPEAGMGLGPANEVYVVMGKSPGYVAVVKITFGGAPSCVVVSGDNFDEPGQNPVGSGPNLDGLNAIDFANGKLFALDAVKENVFAIDPSSGARTLVSSPAPIDAGAPILDAGADADAGDAGYDAAGGNGSGQVTATHCFTDATGGSNVFAFTTGTTAWSGAALDSAKDLFTNIDLTTGNRTCFATTVPCHPDEQNGQAIDRSAGIFASPTATMVLTAGATTIWTVDTLNHVANVISE